MKVRGAELPQGSAGLRRAEDAEVSLLIQLQTTRGQDWYGIHGPSTLRGTAMCFRSVSRGHDLLESGSALIAGSK